MFDTKVLDEMYDDSVQLGLPLMGFALFDPTVLFPRSSVLEVIEGEKLTMTQLDELAEVGSDTVGTASGKLRVWLTSKRITIASPSISVASR
jgi:hypothetical protein